MMNHVKEYYINNLFSILDKRIITFSNDITEVRRLYGKFRTFDTIGPSAPVFDKYNIFFMLKYLEENNIDVSKYFHLYNKILEKLKDLEAEKGREYKDLLYKDLKLQADAYPEAFISDFSGGFYDEAEQEFSMRTVIEILILELEKDFDLSEIKKKVAEGDKKLKKFLIENIEIWEEEFRSPIDYTYFPDRFWWEHLPESLK